MLSHGAQHVRTARKRPQEADEMNLSRLFGATMVAGALGPAGATVAAAAGNAAAQRADPPASGANAPADHVPDSRSGPGARAGLAMPPAGAASR
jgi:hypothetical protein